ncbi:hypothetical protein GQX74_000573 [Glossina fuscipes]|nr:hypothetical protein GQX74_000573 [Glossina fuscipes]
MRDTHLQASIILSGYFTSRNVVVPPSGNLEAMEETHPKCIAKKQFQKSSACPREGFPANIKSVASIGASSLIIKWEIIDCENIKGYELFLDGYLSNRYYSPRHESAVIVNVNIDQPHKVILLALNENSDTSLDVILRNRRKMQRPCIMDCETRVLKCPPSSHTSGRMWVPSFFIYEPVVKARQVESEIRLRPLPEYCPIRQREEDGGEGEPSRNAPEEQEEILPDYEELIDEAAAIVKQEERAEDAVVVKEERAEDALIVKQELAEEAAIVKHELAAIKEEADELAAKQDMDNDSRLMEDVQIKREQSYEDVKKETD